MNEAEERSELMDDKILQEAMEHIDNLTSEEFAADCERLSCTYESTGSVSPLQPLEDFAKEIAEKDVGLMSPRQRKKIYYRATKRLCKARKGR